MAGHRKSWRTRLNTAIHNREALSGHPWLHPIADRVLHPRLWRFRCEEVARGVAVGAFWVFAIPFAQIVIAASHCVWWRANIPAAAAMTLVTNPLTIGFWLWLAYQTGLLVMGGSASPPGITGSAGVASWIASIGWPTMLGMGLFAVGGAAAGYLVVKLVWRARLGLKRKRIPMFNKSNSRA